jgi:hypothetical protein
MQTFWTRRQRGTSAAVNRMMELGLCPVAHRVDVHLADQAATSETGAER